MLPAAFENQLTHCGTTFQNNNTAKMPSTQNSWLLVLLRGFHHHNSNPLGHKLRAWFQKMIPLASKLSGLLHCLFKGENWINQLLYILYSNIVYGRKYNFSFTIEGKQTIQGVSMNKIFLILISYIFHVLHLSRHENGLFSSTDTVLIG